MSLRLLFAIFFASTAIISVLGIGDDTKELKNSDLDVLSNDTVGEDMFSIANKKDPETKVKFGFGKIAEVKADGTLIEKVNHFCNFKMDNITCTDEGVINGSFDAVDADGNSTKANYKMRTKTCALSACNTNTSAKLIVKSFIMQNKAYLCQPDCEAEDNYQSPVFNGTAKLEIEIANWNFCEAGTVGCDGEVATDMKIFFSVKGQKKGKEMKAKKKNQATFNKEKGKFAEKCKEQGSVSKPSTDNSGKKPDGAGNPKSGAGSAGQKGDRKGKGKCRNALFTSFGDEPDDQESFSLAEADGTESTTTVRLFSMAITDGSKLLANGTGFEGPKLEEVESNVGNSEQKKMKQYVTIKVSKFESKLVYDPTVDMNADGGTNGDPTNSGCRVTFSLTLLLTAVLTLLNPY